MSSSSMRDSLRDLPAVEALANRADVAVPRKVAVAAARSELEKARRRLLAGEEVDVSALDSSVQVRAEELSRASPRPLINATGVILHTNLGRAPLAAETAEAAALAGASYTDLEYDLVKGERGSRQAHIEQVLCELTGGEAAMAVNNNAAAVLLALSALGGGGEVIVSRGQLIEIGGSFRIPEILAQSGARLVEIGTTNRTRLSDYEQAIGPQTTALLRVHQSNFRTVGFTEEVRLLELCRLGAEHDLPVIDDVGSGALAPTGEEPTLQASVGAGAALVCCSADKLLGGPQAGLLAGDANAISRCRNHPLARALRIDAMQLAALAATLRLHRFGDTTSIPAVAMLAASDEELRERAGLLREEIGASARVIESASRPGGGSLPGTELEGPVCEVEPDEGTAEALAAALRAGDPPLIARIADGRVVLDPRTIDTADIALAGELVRSAIERL